MKIVLILFFVYFVNAIKIDNQIAGGNAVNPHQFPFAVVVFSRPFPTGAERLCAGALISRQSILTAASCVNNRIVRVGLGIHDLNDPWEQFAVWMDIQNITVNPGFESDNTMDIAILTLPNSIGFFNHAVQIISLPNEQQLFPNTAGNAVGWGCSSVGPNPANCAPTFILRSASVTTASTCTHPHLVCSTGLLGGFICAGDEGGPLFTSINGNFVLMGINHNFPNLCTGTMNFVRITSFLSWIRDNMWKVLFYRNYLLKKCDLELKNLKLR